ncbi:MAG: Sua5/YciO/YrdC/YwlC family protein, partial [Nitrospirota bacterium]
MMTRLQIDVRGAVQGVGFRPFVYRLATSLGLPGWVANGPEGVTIQVEGEPSRLRRFLLTIEREPPPRAAIHSVNSAVLDPAGFARFEIRASRLAGEPATIPLPDMATCEDCCQELFDPANRRYRYPFTNCTNCGPRYSIIEALPYDRANTTMRRFVMCPACRREYDDPNDRRFHAQPNACPACGPRLELNDDTGRRLAEDGEALRGAAEAIRGGRIVAVKGLGGFQLIVDGANDAAVLRLRERKRREEKPFALMFPSLDAVKAACHVSAREERLLRSPQAPIVLLKKSADRVVAPSVAPGNPYLGIMLPSTPLHHLLMAELGAPVVATSGNRSDEPICTGNAEAMERLKAIADLWL